MSYKSIYLSILSAGLLILSFPKLNLAFLAWFALVPWFFALRGQRPAQAFLISYLVGLVFFSGVIYWVTYVSYLGFTVLVVYLALYFAVFGLVFTIYHSPFATSNIFVIPAAWVALELLRSHLFSGFSWALLGYSQYLFLPIIQISDITGAYGISFLLVLVNVGIWQILVAIFQTRSQKSEVRSRIFLSSVICLLSSVILVLGYGYFKLSQKPQGQTIKVAVVQGNIPQWQKWDLDACDYILERYLHLTKQSALSQAKLIIWPETSVPGYLEDDPQLFEAITSLSKEISPAYLLVGTPQEGESRRTYNSATLLFQGKIIQRYDKLHLVPFGEFIPMPLFFSRFSFAGLIGDFSPGRDYTVFSLAQTKPEIHPIRNKTPEASAAASLRISNGVKFSALICFEDVFAHLVRRFVQKGAQILVNMTNDAWFRDSSEPEQHLQASVLRAVENRVNVVRSANTGVSCFINPWGKILSRVSDYSGQTLLVQGENTQGLQIISMTSFYTAFGDVFAWLCVGGATFSLIRRRQPPPRRLHI